MFLITVSYCLEHTVARFLNTGLKIPKPDVGGPLAGVPLVKGGHVSFLPFSLFP